ncbi:MAG TPA: translocation/assembly module TamB domain-containing protein [Candidatus Baltobacteraceae bacterium]
MRRNVSRGLAAAAVLIVLAVVIWHHAVARFVVATAIGLTTGYHVDIGEMRLGRDHGALIDTHVSKHGEPVLDAARIDLYYHLRDLLPGSKHRFGLLAVTIDRPQLTIVHHRDRTYNISSPGGGAPGAPGRPDTVPLNFTARIRGGTAQLIDDYQYYKDARAVRVDNIDANLAVNTETKTHYTVTGTFEDVRPEPFAAAGSIDYGKGYAMHRVRAAAIPLKAIGNYIIDSPAAHILTGTARDFHATIYALGIAPNVPIAYHVMAGAQVADAQLSIHGLSDPLDNIRGTLQIFDGGLAAKALHATIDGIPVRVAGGIFDFSKPQFRLGMTGAGDLDQLRHVLAFSAHQPVRGHAQINVLIEGPISQPLLLVGFDSQRAYYGALPFDRAHGVIALYNGDVAIVPLKAFFGGLDVRVRGRLTLGTPLQTELVAHYEGPSSRVPYLGALVTDQPLAGEGILAGSGAAIGARGFLASTNAPLALNAFYDIGGDGVGTIGPLSVVAANGGTLDGAYAIDRSRGTSAFWATAQNLPVRQPHPIELPGVRLPQLPALGGTIVDASVVGSGGFKDLVLGGRVVADGATVGGVRFTSLDALFAGPLANVAMERVHADGSFGTFDGAGSFAPGRLVARGTYAGTFQDLAQFTGNIGARGDVSGPVAVALVGNRTIVQARGVRLRAASIHGIPVQSASGTIAVTDGVLRVYNANVAAAGGSLVAAGAFGTSKSASAGNGAVALATTQLDGAQLRGLGIPLQSGDVNAVGTVKPGGKVPAFDGGVVVRNGRAQGYDVAGSAHIAVANDAVQVRNGVAALGQTYGILDGAISGLTSGAPRYAVRAQIPAGDIATAAQTFHIPTHVTDGSFSADLLVGGRGSDPSVSGPLQVPVGSTNGLGFLDASALIGASRAGVRARDGSVQVGSTHAFFSASLDRGATAVHVRSRRANLADFNDYFDTGDTLAGSGYLDLSLAQTARTVSTNADLDIETFRYRSLPIGNTDAHWKSTNNVARGHVTVGGEHGLLKAAGSVALVAAHTLPQTIARSRYDLRGTLANLDLSTWLPALGFPQVPLTGRVDGEASVAGRYPHLAVGGHASIAHGNIGPLPIESGQVTARANGARINVTSAQLTLPALVASGGGSFGLAPRDPIALTVHAQTSDPKRLLVELTKKTYPVTGAFTTTVQIAGTFKAPVFSAGLEATDAEIYGLKIPAAVGALALNGRSLVVRNAEVTFGKGQATLAGALPLQLLPFGIGPSGAPISLDLTARAVELAAFSNALGNATKLGGTVDGHLGLGGTVGDPRIYGQLAVADGSYVSALEKTPIHNTVAQVSFDGTSATLGRFHASLGRGSLDGDGTVGFRGGIERGAIAYDFHAAAHGAQLDFPAYGSGTLDAKLHLAHTPGTLARLSGTAAAADAVVPFSAFYHPAAASAAGGAASPTLPFNLAFDLQVTAGRNVRVRAGGIGAGLDITGSGKALLAGTLAAPTLDGTFNSSGGALTYFDHAFKVQSGSIRFDPANGLIPTVTAVATTHVVNPDPNVARNPTGGVDITLRVDGPLDALSLNQASNSGIAISSIPGGYTRDQLIALLLPFGGFVTSVQFTDTGQIIPPGQLKGAPPPGSGALLPQQLGLLRQTGTLTIGQEAFNVLNAQFATGIFGPIERVLSNSLGFSDVNFTIDYSGNVGMQLQRRLSHDISAFYGTTFRTPIRESIGAEYSPGPFQTAQFTFFVQQGALDPRRAKAGQALQGTSGFTFSYQRLF